ncbi:hypothetical protein M5K25_006447 [Dendrobium thyrsiflorum]|uniref:Disease resistance N-terminal domain-containing protein n=1 Tax=Dendrobium thyrsiflorum TaxID=117978 RepID=A0ABD0VB44_DENTH
MSQNLLSSIAAECPVSFVSTLVSNILNKLISPAIQQLSVDFGIDVELNKLKMILVAIQPKLVEAEERQHAEIYFKLWLSAFKDAAYEIEDLLDDLNYGARRKSIKQENKIKKVLYSCFFSNSITSFKLCWRLNIIIKKMKDLVDEIHRFGFRINRVPQISDYSRPQTHSYVDKETVIGREKDKEDILFRRRALAKDTEEPECLVKIGKDILKRCNGLPLAIVTIGGMMRHENDEAKWKAVLDSETWQLDVANNFT